MKSFKGYFKDGNVLKPKPRGVPAPEQNNKSGTVETPQMAEIRRREEAKKQSLLPQKLWGSLRNREQEKKDFYRAKAHASDAKEIQKDMDKPQPKNKSHGVPLPAAPGIPNQQPLKTVKSIKKQGFLHKAKSISHK